ncbi:MAG TPA: mechanosensitive ion channel domain-containing protein [Stellaceae bacterium]|nr:mechanosensitive ion channel domain-containing protein [Stellaceae bacterium]
MPHCPRIRRGVALIIAAFLALAAPARAQSAAAPPAAQQPVSADELQHLVDSLNDPAQRQALVKELQALIAAERGIGAKPPAPQNFFDRVSGEIDTITGEILAAAQVAVDAPRLVHWTKAQIANTELRDFWIAVLLRLAVIFGAGMLADRIVFLLLRGPARRIDARAGARAATRIFLILLGIVIESLPVAVFAAAASFAVPFTSPDFGTREVARVLISAILWARLILAAAHVLLLSNAAEALYPLSAESRNYLYIWTRRFTAWAVYGFSLAAAAWWLGVPGAIYALILRTTAVVLAILAVIFVMQNRRGVADWLRGEDDGGAWRLIRHRIADTWHVLAIVYVAGTFGVYVLDVSGGYLFLLRATLASVVVLLGSALVLRFIRHLSERGFAIPSDMKTRYPTLETRANRYVPVLYYIAAAIIYLVALLTLLQAWGISAYSWLDTETGRAATGTAVTIAIVIVVALIVWELFSSGVERYFHGFDSSGRPLARSARARTLLPIIRACVLVVIVTLVGLVVLAQVGVNIAPLLAGAGVVGLAVGFASQALLKDLIIGLIILAEDTLAVGDYVNVGAGEGIIETLTVRALRVRDASGALVTIPFSEVTTIKNMTREFAYALHDVGVLYREDPDKVVTVLRGVADEMRGDPQWKSQILAPLEIVGLDRFTDSAQVIRVRLKTAPLAQFGVQREFNRRMKKAFDTSGIEMPAANQTHYLPDGKA